jgi:cytochrome P450
VVIHGTEMKEDDVVFMMSGSANRDERQFSSADVFDIGRALGVRSIGVHFGPHRNVSGQRGGGNPSELVNKHVLVPRGNAK